MKTLKDLFNKYGEVICYLIFGVLTTVVSLGVYYACVITVLNPENPIQLQIANVVSWIAAVTFAYVTNRKYVFHSTYSNRLRETVSFYLARLSTLLIDMVSMFIMVNLAGIDNKIAKLIVQVIVLVSNYVLSKYLVFRKGKSEKA